VRFCRTEPRLPNVASVSFDATEPPIALTADMTREQVINYVDSLRKVNVTADMAFYAWRDLSRTDPGPFIQAAMERNPVCSGAAVLHPDGQAQHSSAATTDIIRHVGEWSDESIYDGATRLAQPDEVWNFRRGDGFEKALMIANILRGREGEKAMSLVCRDGQAILMDAEGSVICSYPTRKEISSLPWIV